MSNPPFSETWVHLPDGQAMCALSNHVLNMGWLMYLKENGDAGFSSRNTGYTGPKDAMIEYRLNNGQKDMYPASWALPLPEIERALAYFEKEAKIPDWISWHNDSDEKFSK